jgi:ribosomal protein S18 acetylase RimI-like enzyme
MQIEIRQASTEDARFVAPLVYSSGREAFDLLFERRGRRAIDFLGYCLARPGGFFGYRSHVVGVLDGQIAAAAAFFTRDGYFKKDLVTSFQALLFYGPLAVPGMIQDGNRVKRLLPPPGRGALYLGDFGVREDCRGHGIGAQILDYGKEQARKKGLAYELDVSVSNPRARALYERYGFTSVSESISDDPRLPSACRMRMSI